MGRCQGLYHRCQKKKKGNKKNHVSRKAYFLFLTFLVLYQSSTRQAPIVPKTEKIRWTSSGIGIFGVRTRLWQAFLVQSHPVDSGGEAGFRIQMGAGDPGGVAQRNMGTENLHRRGQWVLRPAPAGLHLDHRTRTMPWWLAVYRWVRPGLFSFFGVFNPTFTWCHLNLLVSERRDGTYLYTVEGPSDETDAFEANNKTAPRELAGSASSTSSRSSLGSCCRKHEGFFFFFFLSSVSSIFLFFALFLMEYPHPIRSSSKKS